jgi:ATP-dependent Clp protease ATP-binding subunit ClpA
MLPAELIARVDEIVCFVPFSYKACVGVVDTTIKDALRFFVAKGLRVIVHDDLRMHIVRELDQRQLSEGARAASRIVQRILVDPLIDHLLTHEPEGKDRTKLTLHAQLNTYGKPFVSFTPEQQ